MSVIFVTVLPRDAFSTVHSVCDVEFVVLWLGFSQT